MPTAASLAFGLRDASPGSPALWGARAIFNTNHSQPYLDLLPDRQDWAVDDTAEGRAAKVELLDRLDRAIPAYREALAAGWCYPPEDAAEEYVCHGVCFLASTHGRSGYLYVTAWSVGERAPKASYTRAIELPKGLRRGCAAKFRAWVKAQRADPYVAAVEVYAEPRSAWGSFDPTFIAHALSTVGAGTAINEWGSAQQFAAGHEPKVGGAR